MIGAMEDLLTDDIRHEIRAMIAEMAPSATETPSENARLAEDLGYDSLALIELAFALEQKFQLPRMGDTSVQHIHTQKDVEDFVIELLGGDG
jgi:acyl carrier protein